MERITISSSLKFKELIRQTISDLKQLDIVGVFPNLDSNIAKEDVNVEYMKKLELEHFEAIDASDGLYVICPNGYVGTLVSVEIGYAQAKGKAIFFSEIPEDLGLQAIATDYISLEEIIKIKSL